MSVNLQREDPVTIPGGEKQTDAIPLDPRRRKGLWKVLILHRCCREQRKPVGDAGG